MTQGFAASALEQTKQFLATIYAPAAEHGSWWFYLWSLRQADKRSWWFPCSATEEAAQKAQDLNRDNFHVYVGVGLSRREGSPHERLGAQQTEAIPALWAEVDYGTNGHKKTDLPPDEACALHILEGMPIRPSLVVRSGGGLYGWWLFKEPWIFEDEADRKLAGECARGWNVLLVREARRQGYGADNVGDLARVLRVPGTTNGKYDPPRPCETVPECWRPDACVNPSDFELWSLAGKPEESRVGPEIVVNGGDAIPAALVQLLINKRKIKATWEKKRDDLADSSQSGYDWELAFLLVEESWADQAIADALCAFRQQHGGKTVPASYYQRTLAGAKERSERRGNGVPAVEKDAIMGLIAALGGGSPDPGSEHFLKLLASLSAKLGSGEFRVLRGRRYEAKDKPSYEIWVEDVTGRIVPISLGNCDGITNQDRCRNAIFDATGIFPPRIKKGWDIIVRMIWAICEKETIEEATGNGQAQSWLENYLDAKPPHEARDTAINLRWPWKEDGKVFFFLEDVRHWLRFEGGITVSIRDLGITLRGFGCENKKITLDVDGKRTSRSLWVIPP